EDSDHGNGCIALVELAGVHFSKLYLANLGRFYLYRRSCHWDPLFNGYGQWRRNTGNKFKFNFYGNNSSFMPE
ncbi:MAG: hypothetical protein ACKO96_06510, partial [Flammeovirgaceae bacterium]